MNSLLGEEDTSRRRTVVVSDPMGYRVTMVVTRYGLGHDSWVALSPDSTMAHTVVFRPDRAGEVCEAIRMAAA